MQEHRTHDEDHHQAALRIRIVLKKAEQDCEKALVGRSDRAPILTLGTDVHAAYGRLRERGVRFLGESYRYPWGIGALLLDQDASPLLLQQEDRVNSSNFRTNPDRAALIQEQRSDAPWVAVGLCEEAHAVRSLSCS